MKKKIVDRIVTGVGALLLIVGLVCVKTLNAQTLPYVCIGIGCGMFAHGLGEIISRRAMRSDPELVRKLEIEKNDERNIALADKSKAKAFDLSLYVFAALMLAFCLMEVEWTVTLLLTAAYVCVVSYWVYCRVQMDKKM